MEETEKPKLEELSEAFKQELENVPLYVESLVTDPNQPMGIEVLLEEMGIEGPFVDLPPLHQKIVIETIQEELGVDFTREPKRRYGWEGPPGTPGEGPAEIDVFPTNQSDLGLHRIKYADGKTSYAFGLF